MNLTRKQALKLHRKLWMDMQNDLGDNPDGEERIAYKDDWCDKHGFKDVDNSCFLCEYSHGKRPMSCYYCPVKWPTWSGICISSFLEDGTKLRGDYYQNVPISEILALPEREDV